MVVVSEWELIIRLLISVCCGLAVGHERKNRSKEAGLRTHTIICLGACLLMIISKYGFGDVEQGKFDAARIAAQVVSGIGFLGAGMIMVRHHAVSGLTTAAGMWTVSAIGLAIGAGMYVIGIGATVLLVLIQVLLHNKRFTSSIRRCDDLLIEVKSDKLQLVLAYFEQNSIAYVEHKCERLSNDVLRLIVEIDCSYELETSIGLALMNLDKDILKVEVLDE